MRFCFSRKISQEHPNSSIQGFWSNPWGKFQAWRRIGAIQDMSGVIIEELDNSSEDSFGTPKSAESADAFHDTADSPLRRGETCLNIVLPKFHEGDSNQTALYMLKYNIYK